MNATDRAENAFLTIHYHDRRQNLETWRIYDKAGDVHIFDGKTWRTDYQLTPDEIIQVKDALERCGVLTATDISAEGVHDTATLEWRWSLDGNIGTLSNRAYPARKHSATDCVMDMLLDFDDKYADE